MPKNKPSTGNVKIGSGTATCTFTGETQTLKVGQPHEVCDHTHEVPTADLRLPEYAGTYTFEDTKDMMTSPDYKIRFVAEYVQLKIRYEKLKAMLNKWTAFDEKFGGQISNPEFNYNIQLEDWMGFIPSCPFGLLRAQQSVMGEYLHQLEVRAVIEDIDLTLVTVSLKRGRSSTLTNNSYPHITPAPLVTPDNQGHIVLCKDDIKEVVKAVLDELAAPTQTTVISGTTTQTK